MFLVRLCTICLNAKLTELPGGDIVKCKIKKGREIPRGVPFYKNGELCKATIFKGNSKCAFPETRIERYKMCACRYAKFYY